MGDGRHAPSSMGPKPVAGPFANLFFDLCNVLLGIGQKIRPKISGPDQRKSRAVLNPGQTVLSAIKKAGTTG